MANWPTLFEMQVADYTEQGEDWRQVAREMVFPGMNGKLPAIIRTYQDLGPIIGPIEDQARGALGFTGQVTYVLYVGIGNGAGWVTTYAGKPAVLLGLEGIVDSGFNAPATLEGLVAHELGHVVHFAWRQQASLKQAGLKQAGLKQAGLKQAGLKPGSGPWWQLYEEGFAQRTEHDILARESWHMRSASSADDWLAWCLENRAWLAAEFLRVAGAGESVRPFFGSWYDIRGRKQTGYYLGHEVITYLADTMPLRDIALLEEGQSLERTMRQVLNELAVGAP